MNTHAEHSIHDEVSLLLPWYVNDTMEESQKALVDKHIRSCIACRRALSTEYRTLDAFRNESPLDQSVQAGFARLHNRIAAHAPVPMHTRSTQTIRHSLVKALGSFAGDGFRPALVAALVAIVAVGLTLMQLAGGQQPSGGGFGNGGPAKATEGYHTLSSSNAGTANVDDVNVIFARYTTTAIIESSLKAVPARIVAGPDDTGVYLVHLENVSNEKEREAAIVKLRNEPHVIFAEAAQPLSVSRQGRAQPQ